MSDFLLPFSIYCASLNSFCVGHSVANALMSWSFGVVSL